METKQWMCIYIDCQDRSHGEFFATEKEAKEKAETIKMQLQKSSENDTVIIFEKDNAYMMANHQGTQVVLVMNMKIDWSELNARNGMSAMHEQSI